MDAYEYGELLKELEIKLDNIEKIIDLENLKIRLEEIAKLEMDEDFWKDAKALKEINIEKKQLTNKLEKFSNAKEMYMNAKEMREEFSDDEALLSELFDNAAVLKNTILTMEIEVMLNDEFDSSNAILSITPGAGGTESCDFANMLYRMYLRWCEKRGYKVEILDYLEGEEAGIKSVSLLIKGENAYGYLKVENGIHRLVRISPFDASAKRHTSFASVQVSPELSDDIEINIEEKDLRIDTYRASGAGGQHVNKTESAIRITHIPTNIVVQCQNDRSQHKNKATAIKMLKSKLYELEKQKQDESKNSQSKSEIGWGYQIRSYVLAPYQSVKDARSNNAYSNVAAILDGDLDAIMQDVLISIAN